MIKATSVDQATIRGILDRLKARGFIALSRDSNDARKVINALTPSGGSAEADDPQSQGNCRGTFGKLNAGERAALLFTLTKMLEDNEQS